MTMINIKYMTDSAIKKRLSIIRNWQKLSQGLGAFGS